MDLTNQYEDGIERNAATCYFVGRRAEFIFEEW